MHTKIPSAELEIFKKLKGISVVFDVGARADVDFLEIKPNATYHLFEPNPNFFRELTEAVGGRKNVYLNNFGLSNESGIFYYSEGLQSFMNQNIGWELPVKTLDWYVKNKRVERIDFLKIDTEGWDYKVLLGGLSILPKTKYIQYEHWGNDNDFHQLLQDKFEIIYIGYRNSLCMNKKLVPKIKRGWVRNFIENNKYGELA